MGKHIVFDLERVERRFRPRKAVAQEHRDRSGLKPRRCHHSARRSGRGRPLHTSPVDRPPRHDRTPASLRTAVRSSQAHACDSEAGFGQGTALCRSPPLRTAKRVRAGDFDAGGIEPLEADLDRFLRLFRGRKTPIKSALLNQKLLRGVGNIYADESLFRAGIRPRRRASTITRDQLAKVARRR